jgi:phage shock protein A
MAGLMSRFTTLFKVKANKVLDKAEDPGETLDYSYQRQLEMLQKVKRGVADVVTAKKRLQLQTAKLEESVVKLDSQAKQALAGGREDLARTALERKSLIQGQLQGLDQQISQLEAQQQNLLEQERRLAAKVESFRTQKEVVKAQYSAAEAQVRIGEATTGLGEEMSDVGMALQRAQDKTEQMQARASAVNELVDTGALDDLTAPAGSDLDRQIAQLSAGNQVDAELARMKAELGGGAPSAQIGQGGDSEPSAAPPASAGQEQEQEAKP